MDLNGIININKPKDITSQTAVTRVKRLLNLKKAGHSGTLDPLATGVLPIMIGTAAKASPWLTGHNKRYIAGVKLGIETDSEDITGNVINEYAGPLPSFEEFKNAAESFIGKINQIPPMYSALKRDGKKLVDLARQGIVIERKAREIQIFSINTFCDDNLFFIDVACSKGTYIRTLCADIGKKLGCGATMNSLKRTQVGSFTIADSVTLEQIEKMNPQQIKDILIDTETVFTEYDIIKLPDFFNRLFKNGAPIDIRKLGLKDIAENRIFRIYDEKGFFALGEVIKIDGNLVLKVKKFF